ncbi:MAG: hypothetical protein ACK2TV_04885 [Anaerolineales bacterium]
MKIRFSQTKDRRDRNAFIQFPFMLYEHSSQWVPPIRREMRKIFKPNYSFYKYGEAAFLIAENDHGETLGRLAMINNHRYNDFHQSKTAFFYYFEVIDDFSIAEALFSYGFDWVRNQGLNRVLGPKGFTILDGFGMLIKGFKFQPAFGQPYNLPYYPDFMDKLGFTKVTDVFSGRMDRGIHFPEKFLRAAKLVEKRLGFYAPTLNTKAELKSVIEAFTRLYNNSLSGPSGNPPLTDEDMENMTSQLLWIADPHLVKIIYKDEVPVGWMLAYPDIGAALQRTKGRLFPFGWLQMWLESKRTNWIDFNGIGILEKYQRLGGTAILYNEIYKSIMDSDQYNYAEFLQFREENINSLLEAANVNIDFHKTHRLYEIFL